LAIACKLFEMPGAAHRVSNSRAGTGMLEKITRKDLRKNVRVHPSQGCVTVRTKLAVQTVFPVAPPARIAPPDESQRSRFFDTGALA
jgi:hypothetical protein